MRTSLGLLLTFLLVLPSAPASSVPAIYSPKSPTYLETLAAREVRRYVYLRTGRLLNIVETSSLPSKLDGFLVANRDRPIIQAAGKRFNLAKNLQGLQKQGYLLKTVKTGSGRLAVIVGADDTGTLYGAYRLCERLGVRFYLHGDLIPDGKAPFAVPDLNEVGKPLFSLRGIQPFHDFPEGPDWWNLADYRAVIQQLPKMRMNFIGLHTYPQPIAEPTVWIGRSRDIGSEGRVNQGYPASYQNTVRGDWGYTPRKTGEFLFGASQLFDCDEFGAEVMRGICPKPSRTADMNAVFERTGLMLRDAFIEAHRLSIKTCVGTETPLTVPDAVSARLKAAGIDSGQPEAVRSLYEGIFRRVAETYPLDYYWLWTPEGWTWDGTKEEQVRRALDDLKLAQQAAKNVDAPFQLATCGWVLGPSGDRSLFNRVLPKSWPVSCINRQVGNDPVDPDFARVAGRDKWAIPWLEDDPGLTAPQLWAGRMRRDAADARRYGCTGLMGIHWRTRVISPNISALAAAGWDQSRWTAPRPTTGPVGGQAAAFPGHKITGAQDEEIYRTVRYGLSAYRIAAPNGSYSVTLRFCEPHYGEAGKRVFGVALNGRAVIQDLDIFARVGRDRALDYSFPNIAVEHGLLEIGFTPKVEFPSIAAIDMTGSGGFSLKINCGGPACGSYIADPSPANDHFPVSDFYRDWAQAEFGLQCGREIGKLFARLDGRLPRPVEWTDGPGGLRPDARPWKQVCTEYAFVDELAAFRSRIKGPGAMERFAYWLNTFRYLRATARLRCVWADLNRAMDAAASSGDPAIRRHRIRDESMPLRAALIRNLDEVYRCLLATVSTTGELGTIANWEQHIRPELLDKTGKRLESLFGEPLPGDSSPPSNYSGPLKLVVLPMPTHMDLTESTDLKAMVLTHSRVRTLTLLWRPMGRGGYRSRTVSLVGRGVYGLKLPATLAAGRDFEYHLVAETSDGQRAVWPSAAPAQDQTMIVLASANKEGK